MRSIAYLFNKQKREAREREFKLVNDYARSRMLLPLDRKVPTEFISIPAKDIPRLAAEYIEAMEIQQSEEWCRCEWIIHPDDVDKPRGKRRKRRGEEAEDCPVHTRAGLIIYFFEWIFSGKRINHGD